MPIRLTKEDENNPPIPPLEKGGKGGFERGGFSGENKQECYGLHIRCNCYAGYGYQTVINNALREYMGKSERPIDEKTLRRVIREELKKTGALIHLLSITMASLIDFSSGGIGR